MAEQCKCGSLDFFMKKQGNNTGLYCSMCGKWQKWMNKDDIRLFEHNHKPKARNTIQQTNADRIRSMSDEELAEFLSSIHTGRDIGYDYFAAKGGIFIESNKNIIKKVQDWLQSERWE